MTTALQIVNGAAEEIGVKTAETPLESNDFQTILDRMNDMLLEWSEDGLTTSFVAVDDSTDTVDVERHAIAAIKYNLALRIAPSFQRPVAPALAMMAQETKQRLESNSVYIGAVAYPDTLPLGSGNECGDYFDARFFEANKVENF